jgi:hypothetical protein
MTFPGGPNQTFLVPVISTDVAKKSLARLLKAR